MASQLSYLQSLTPIPLFISFLFLQLSPIDARGITYNDNGITAADLNSGSLIQVKIWCAIILLISTFAGGLSPYFFRQNDTFLLLGTQFAGGVFLATALVQYLGDSVAISNDLFWIYFKVMLLFGLVGYLVAMLVNCLVTKFGKNKERESRSEVGDSEEGKFTGIDVNSGFTQTNPIGDTILLVLALCFHSVFEGIAVGVSGWESYAWRCLWTTLLHQIPAAIAMGITALKMQPKRPFLLTLSYSIAFAISSPIGVGIGLAIDRPIQVRSAYRTYAIVIGIACGVLIYVAINHLIAKGFRPLRNCYFDSPFYKFLGVFVGVALTYVALIFDD